MDRLRVGVADSDEIKRLADQFGIRQTDTHNGQMWVVARRQDSGAPVGVMLLRREADWYSGLSAYRVRVVRVAVSLRPSHRRKVRVQMFADCPAAVASNHGDQVAVYAPITNQDRDEEAAEIAGWRKGRSCWLKVAGQSERRAVKVAAMWNEEI